MLGESQRRRASTTFAQTQVFSSNCYYRLPVMVYILESRRCWDRRDPSRCQWHSRFTSDYAKWCAAGGSITAGLRQVLRVNAVSSNDRHVCNRPARLIYRMRENVKEEQLLYLLRAKRRDFAGRKYRLSLSLSDFWNQGL